MDENIVRAVGAILSRRDREELRGIFVGFAIAEAFVHEKGAKELFESAVMATHRELKLYPGHDGEDELKVVKEYAQLIFKAATTHLKMERMSRAIHDVAEIFGTDAAVELAQKVGGTVVEQSDPRDVIERVAETIREKCKSCDKEECPVHPDNSDDGTSHLVH